MALTVTDTGFSLYDESYLGTPDGTSSWGHSGFADGSVWHKYDKPTGVNGCMGYRVSEGAGLAYLFYSPQNLNFSTTYAGFHIAIWIYCADPSRLKSLAAGGGLFLVAGSSTTNYKKFLIASGDSYDQLKNGFTKFTFDPRNTATSTVGTPDMTNVCLFGVFADSSLSSERYNLFIGGIRIEGVLSVTGTSTSFWSDLSALNKGRVLYSDGTYYVHGGITIGSNVGSVTTNVSDSKKNVVFTQLKYYRSTSWYSLRADETGGISIIDGDSSPTLFKDGTLIFYGITKWSQYVPEGYAYEGSTFLCTNTLSGSFISDGVSNSSSRIILYSTILKNFAGGCKFPTVPPYSYALSVDFIGCGEVLPGGVYFRDCNFINSVSSTAALILSTTSSIRYCKFLKNTNCPAIRISPYDYFLYIYGLEFYGNTIDVQNLYSSNIRIRFKEGTYITTYSGNITLQPYGTVTIEGTVSLLGAEIRFYALDGQSGDYGTYLGGVESCSNTYYSHSYTYNSIFWLQILKPGYKEFGIALTVLQSDYTFKAHLEPDKNT